MEPFPPDPRGQPVSLRRVGATRILRCAALLAVLGSSTRCHQAAAPREVRISLLPYLSYAPLLIADEEGDFRREGIVVRFVPFRRNSDATVALLAGRLDATAGIVTPGD